MSERQASTFRKGHSQYEVDLLNALNVAKIAATYGDVVSIGIDEYLIPDLIVPITPGLVMAVEVMARSFTNAPFESTPESSRKPIRQDEGGNFE